MISQTAEYALRAVVWLARNREGPASTHRVAAGTQVPNGYLSKVLQELSRADLVRSHPGRRGGFTLARAPESISVLDVVSAVAPLQRIETCPLGIHGHALCPLHRRLDDALAEVGRAFGSTSIAELLPTDLEAAPLCVREPRARRAGVNGAPRRAPRSH